MSMVVVASMSLYGLLELPFRVAPPSKAPRGATEHIINWGSAMEGGGVGDSLSRGLHPHQWWAEGLHRLVPIREKLWIR